MALKWSLLTIVSISLFLFALHCNATPKMGMQKVQKNAISENEGGKVASKQLEAIERKINEFQMVLKKRLTDPKTLTPTKPCLKQCQENLSDAVDDVKTGIESIQKQDLWKAKADVSAIATEVDTCNDCFMDLLLEDQEIKAFDDWVRGVTGDCLVNLKKM